MKELAIKNESQGLTKDASKIDWKKVVDEYLFTSSLNMPETTKALFYRLSATYGLDPFKRELHPLPFFNRDKNCTDYEFVTGYLVYIRKAQESGMLNGWESKVVHDETGTLIGSQVTIYRKDWDKPLIWVALLSEFIGKKKDGGISKNWSSMPVFMITKVAISQAFRLAFPETIGGLPYTSDEIEESDGSRQRDVSPEKKEPEKTTPPKGDRKAKTPATEQEIIDFLVYAHGFSIPDGEVSGWIDGVKDKGSTKENLEEARVWIEKNCKKIEPLPVAESPEIQEDTEAFEKNLDSKPATSVKKKKEFFGKEVEA